MVSLRQFAGMIAATMLATISPGSAAHAQEPGTEAQPQGALTGASIFLSPGHGWLYNADNKRWTTQRGVSHGIIEDHSNAEAVLQYLTKYLWNAGARVYVTRERDMNTNMAIVSAGGEGVQSSGGWSSDFTEGTWDGRLMRVKSVAGEPTARATFTPTIPEAGYYGVYIWYRPSPDGDSANAANFIINHTGGSTRWVQDLNKDGYTWKYVGTYWFDAGASSDSGSVVVTNQANEADKWVTLSAVRFGGGMGDVIRNDAPSGNPRFEESGLYTSQFYGYRLNDTRVVNSVSAMPMWAEWEAEEWEKGKTIYVSWHTNASGDHKSRGLFSFVYGPNPWDPLTSFTGYPGGVELVVSVHDEIIRHVHASYDPNWRDGAKITRWLGETNPRNNNKMPAALFEYGFHDNAEDAAYILDPKFRDTVAKGTYEGIVKFYAQNMEGFDNTTIIPEKPTHLNLVAGEDGKIKVRWQAPPSDGPEGVLGDPATGYRVYTSRNGKGFDNGTAVEGTETEIPGPRNGEPLYIRVSAVNAGGESFPTETLAWRAESQAQKVLLVNGFDRLDREMNTKLPSGAERGVLQRMNSFDYAIQHTRAIAPAGFAIDSASDEAVTSGTVSLQGYAAVVWMLGQEKGPDAFDPAQLQAVRDYVANGGGLLVSGSDLLGKVPVGERLPVADVLGAELAADNSGSWRVAGARGSIFEGLPVLAIDDGTQNVYRVQSPDALTPQKGSAAAMIYAGTDQVAAVQNEAKGRTILLGFPFETITDEAMAREVMRRSLEWLTGGTTVAK